MKRKVFPEAAKADVKKKSGLSLAAAVAAIKLPVLSAFLRVIISISKLYDAKTD